MSDKRLFIFAAYDPRDSIVDDSLIMYVRALSEIGDVIFYMDNNMSASEISKIKPYVLYAGASNHKEYDFGSYKRGYTWARNNDLLKDYKWIYLVNDSVYGPLWPLLPVLLDLESRNTDSVAMVFKAHRNKSHLQSWFIGMSQRVFLSEEFDSFITSVKHQENKAAVTHIYEQGLTKLIKEKGWSWSAAYTVRRHGVYNKIKHLFQRGMPFIKKSAFIRHHGALGSQVNYVLNHINPTMSTIILDSASRVYGKAWLEKFLTSSIFKTIYRNIRHSLYKIFSKGV